VLVNQLSGERQQTEHEHVGDPAPSICKVRTIGAGEVFQGPTLVGREMLAQTLHNPRQGALNGRRREEGLVIPCLDCERCLVPRQGDLVGNVREPEVLLLLMCILAQLQLQVRVQGVKVCAECAK